MSLLTALVWIGVVGLGCAATQSAQPNSNPPTTAPATKPAEQASITGRLESGIMAIGGEHTGWAIGGVESDVSAVQADARNLDGKPVMAWGREIIRAGVERGDRKIFVVEKLEALPVK